MTDPLHIYSQSDEFWDIKISRYVGPGIKGGVTWSVRSKKTGDIEQGYAKDKTEAHNKIRHAEIKLLGGID